MALTGDEIAAVMGEPAKAAPVRVFVGLDTAAELEDRVDILMDEMIRAGAFERQVLAFASPTGSGYINYVFAEALEYMTLGDCAISTMQYSMLPSSMSLTRTGLAIEQPHIEHFKKIAPEANFVLETLNDGYFYDKKFTLPFADNVTRTETHLGDLYGHKSIRLVIGEEGWNSDFWIEAIEKYGKGLLGVHKETNNMWIEILHDEADKSFAVEYVRNELDIPMNRVVVMGDGHNDIKMFQWANNGGKSFVMGQAHPEVKKHAMFENLSVDKQGVAEALKTLFN
jgi:hypothetical protein